MNTHAADNQPNDSSMSQFDNLSSPETSEVHASGGNPKVKALINMAHQAGGKDLLNSLRAEISALAQSDFRSEDALQLMDTCARFQSKLANLEGSFAALKRAKNMLVGDVFQALIHQTRSSQEQKGETPASIILRLTCCPDYPFDEVSGEYTSGGGLRGGVGLSAMTLTKATMPLCSLLSEFNIPTEIEYHYADIEVDDPDDLTYSNLTVDQFLGCVKQSRAAAEKYGAEAFKSISEKITVTASSMRERFSRLPTLLLEQDIDPSTAYGLKIRRLEHYQRFYQQHLRASSDTDAFLLHRARIDISQHVNLAHTVFEDRRAGQRVSLCTGSIDALAEHLRVVGNHTNPVFRLT